MTAAKASGPLCESCGLRPATGTVPFGLVVPFAVCEGCRPTALTPDGDAVLVAPDLH